MTLQIKESLRDKIARKMVPVMNCLSDKKIQLAGSTSYIMRISQKAPEKQTVTDWMDVPRNDVFGDYVESLETEIIGSVIINYPLNGAEVFSNLNYEEDQVKAETTAIDLNEFFPITMRAPFPGVHDSSPKNTEIKKGDIVVDIFWNERNEPIPVILSVSRMRGSFFQKRMANRLYELALYRGEPPLEIKTKIDEFIVFMGNYEKQKQAEM